jgi:hypothetical protein
MPGDRIPHSVLPLAEMGTAQQENAMSVFNTVSVNGLQQEGLLLPTREELGERAFDTIRFWMESGHSQLLSREQALQIAAWGLKIAGERELQHQVLAELVELPENYG